MKIKTILYFFLILNSLTLFSCSQESDITVLNNRISELIGFVEDHQESKVSDYLAKDFLTAENLNKTQFLLFIRFHLKRNKNISIVILDKDVIANNDYYDVTFKVLLLGSNSFIPEKGQTYNVASKWNKYDGMWVMSRLRWEKAKLTE